MSASAKLKNQSILISPKKPFDLPVYAQQMAKAFADFGCSKPKRRKDTYALNVLQFIDGSASEGTESSNSSKTSDSATECAET